MSVGFATPSPLRYRGRVELGTTGGEMIERMLGKLAAFALVAVMAACTSVADLDEAPVDLGDFVLGHNIVVADKARQAGLSRDASKDEWVTALTTAVDERFGRYDGARLYHLGISVEGYSVAPAGVPLVVSPKSVLVIRVTLWDDKLGKKLNEKAKQMTVFESLSGDTLIGSGLTQTKEEQVVNLSRSAAKMIENWMLEHPEWFPKDPDALAAEAKPKASKVTEDAAKVTAKPVTKTTAPTAAAAKTETPVKKKPVVANGDTATAD